MPLQHGALLLVYGNNGAPPTTNQPFIHWHSASVHCVFCRYPTILLREIVCLKNEGFSAALQY